MNNAIVNIGQITQSQSAQSKNVNFDLSDDTFANILDEKLDNSEKIEQQKKEDIMSKLGVPMGLNIEGFDYNSSVDSTDKVEAINTDSDIQDDKGIDISLYLEKAKDVFESTSNLIADSFNSNGTNNAMSEVKKFWQNQVGGFYNTMNKEVVENIEDLVAKL